MVSPAIVEGMIDEYPRPGDTVKIKTLDGARMRGVITEMRADSSQAPGMPGLAEVTLVIVLQPVRGEIIR
jgi:hypothetical protein